MLFRIQLIKTYISSMKSPMIKFPREGWEEMHYQKPDQEDYSETYTTVSRYSHTDLSKVFSSESEKGYGYDID